MTTVKPKPEWVSDLALTKRIKNKKHTELASTHSDAFRQTMDAKTYGGHEGTCIFLSFVRVILLLSGEQSCLFIFAFRIYPLLCTAQL